MPFDTTQMADKQGFVFGIFPLEMIESLSSHNTNESRTEAFAKFKLSFKENMNEEKFMRFSGSFFSFVSVYLKDRQNVVVFTCLEIISDMIRVIPGISLVTRINSILEDLMRVLASKTVELRNKAREILTNSLMVISTSNIIPVLLRALKSDDDWIILYETLEIFRYLFENIESIYNDIDFENPEDFDVNIALEILHFFNHNSGRVRKSCRSAIKALSSKVFKYDQFIKLIQFYVSDEFLEDIRAELEDTNTNILLKSRQLQQAEGIIVDNKFTKIKSERDKFEFDSMLDQNEFIRHKLKKYEEPAEEGLLMVDESKMEKVTKGTKKELSKVITNFKNFGGKLNREEIEIQLKKSKMKRYNDPTEIKENEILDKKYDYTIREQEHLSPLKYPQKQFSVVLQGMQNNLNWEKQFKSLDLFRKAVFYNADLVVADSKYFNSLLEETLKMLDSIRSLLIKNALLTLIEIFQLEGLVSFANYTEEILDKLIKKLSDKNSFISKESDKALKTLKIKEFHAVFRTDSRCQTYAQQTGRQAYDRDDKNVLQCFLISCLSPRRHFCSERYFPQSYGTFKSNNVQEYKKRCSKGQNS